MRSIKKVQVVLALFLAFSIIFTTYGSQNVLAAISATGDNTAMEIIKGFTVDKWGNVKCGALSFEVQLRDKNWIINKPGADTLQFDEGYPKSGENSYSIQGNLNLLNGAGSLRWQNDLVKTADNSFRITYSGERATPIELKSAALNILSPVDTLKGQSISVDGNKISMPADCNKANYGFVYNGKCKELIIPYNNTNIKITGDITLYIQDNRMWNENNFEIRLGLTPSNGSITKTSGSFTITQEPNIPMEIIKGFTFDKWGNVKCGPLSFEVQLRDKNWIVNKPGADTLQFDEGYPKRGENTYSVQGNLNLLNNAGSLHWQNDLVKTAGNSFSMTCSGESATPVVINSAALSIMSTVDALKGQSISIDGNKIIMPEVFKDSSIYNGKCKELIIPYNNTNIKITGITYLYIQDNRAWNQNSFEIRLSLTPSSGSITKTTGSFTITQEPMQIIKGFTVDKYGNIKCGLLSFEVQLRDKNWEINRPDADTLVFDQGYPKRGENTYSVQGNLNLHNGAGSLHWHNDLVKTAGNSFSMTCSGESATPIELNAAALNILSPADVLKGQSISVDGNKITMPADCNKANNGFVYYGKCKELIIPYNCTNIVITGDITLYIQDNRVWNQNSFEIRLSLTPSSGSITKTSGSFTITREYLEGPFACKPIDISSACNMGFADEIADDQKGGWTDQGRENDLSSMQPGSKELEGLNFNVIDPAKNNGASCMVFGFPGRNYFLQQAEIKNVNDSFSYLYLLHADAWAPKAGTTVGTVQVQYTDGTKKDIDIVQGREVGDWWSPVNFENGTVAWESCNKSSDVGLYLSQLPIEKKPIQSIVFSSAGTSLWMVVSLTGSDAEIPMDGGEPVTLVEDSTWKPLPVQKTDIAAGSILDLSAFQDSSPAGQYGPVVIRDGHFEFQNLPGKQQKFYGTNICFSANYLSKADTDQFVSLYKKMGYNSIRIHHYERDLIKAGANTSLELDPKKFDQIDYLFAKLKENGVYFTTDMFVSRPIQANEIEGYPNAIPEADMGVYKGLVMVYGPALENWKAFAKQFLTHKNPYTGMTWAEDPALFSISMVNEGGLANYWTVNSFVKDCTLKLFEEWKVKQQIGTVPKEQEQVIFDRFLTERQDQVDKEMSDYLKSLGVQAVFTDGNLQERLNSAFNRNELDYVDGHGYWDHMAFLGQSWQLPFKFNNKSSIPSLAALPRKQCADRIIGKPFTYTEFNFVYPNCYRSEGGAILGGYASLQDWDAIYRFNLFSYADELRSYTPSSAFDIISDPISYLSDKLGILLFRRGDVSPAKGAIPFEISESYLKDGENYIHNEVYPYDYSLLSLFTKTGTVALKNGEEPKAFDAVVGKQDSLEEQMKNNTQYFKADSTMIQKMLESGVLSKENFDTDRQIFKSDTGEIALDGGEGTFNIVTPKTEVMVIPDKKTAAGNILTAESKDGFCTVSASAMDGQTLESSKRILIMHLTDVKNSNSKFADKDMKIQTSNGGAPSLVRSGKAEITMKLDGDVEVYGCDLTGNRVEKIPVSRNGDSFTFTAQTVKDGKAAYMVYEVVRIPLPKLDSLDLKTDKSFAKTGDTALLTLTGIMSDGTVADISSAEIVYSSDNEQVAAVAQNGTVTAVGEGIAKIKASVKIGNITKEAEIQITVDGTPPVTTSQISGTAISGWYTGDVTITMSVYDYLSGAEKTEYRLSDSGDWITYTEPLIITQDGSYIIQYHSTDKAGNVEEVKQEVVKLDKTAPVTMETSAGTVRSDGTYNSHVAVTLASEDAAGGSGVAGIEYSLDGTTWLAYTAPLEFDDNGTYSVSYKSTDNAGNVEVVKNVSIIVSMDPDVMVSYLKEKVNAISMEDGIKNSLVSKLDNALSSISKENKNSPANQLNAFINEVDAQSGKKLTAEQADVLKAEANKIIARINQEW